MKVCAVYIYDPVDNEVRGISAIYRTKDVALDSLDNHALKGFIDYTEFEDIFVNSNGELLVTKEFEVIDYPC